MNFFDFLEIIKNLPKPNQIDELCESDDNFNLLKNLASWGYFKLLSPTQKYELFVTACAHESVDIAMLLYNNDIDMIGVKNLMMNFMAEVGSNSEYVIFRWIWENNSISFNKDEINDCFIKILKSANLDFIKWFGSQSIDWNDSNLKIRIGNEVLNHVDLNYDYNVAKYVCEQYRNNYLTTSE